MRLRVKDNTETAGWRTRFAFFPRWCGDREDTGFGYSYDPRNGTWVWLEKYEHYWNGGSWSFNKRRLIEEIYDPNQ